jgi:hypothetical protein
VLNVIRRLHRAGVDRVAELPWLRDRAGARSSWAHYEHHARAWHRARRLAAHGAPRTLTRWQAAIGRIVGTRTLDEGPER